MKLLTVNKAFSQVISTSSHSTVQLLKTLGQLPVATPLAADAKNINAKNILEAESIEDILVAFLVANVKTVRRLVAQDKARRLLQNIVPAGQSVFRKVLALTLVYLSIFKEEANSRPEALWASECTNKSRSKLL